MQRFGVSSVPTHMIGINVIKKQWKEVIENILKTSIMKETLSSLNKTTEEWLSEDMPQIDEVLKITPKYSNEYKILFSLKHTKTAYVNAFKTLNKQLQVLYPHAYQSYNWNKTVSQRLKKYGLEVLIGDVVKKSSSIDIQDNIPLEELIEDEVEIVDNDITDDDYEYITEENKDKYTIYDVVIPLVGLKSMYPKNETTEDMNKLLEEDGIKFEDFIGGNFKGAGHYRKIIQRPNELIYDILRHDNPDEDLQTVYYNVMKHPGSSGEKYRSLRLQFKLPQSTYATMLFRELTKTPSNYLYQSNLSSNIK
jgi:tRNA pseudouridine13 synthase